MSKQIPLLNHLGWKVDLGSDLSVVETILSLPDKPDVILISWDLKDQSVVQWYNRLSGELKVPCLVFSESDSRQVTNEMLKSRIKDIILPPISAHGINRRIELLVRTRNTELKLRNPKPVDMGKGKDIVIDEEKRLFVDNSSSRITSAMNEARSKSFGLNKGASPKDTLSRILALSFEFKGQPAYLFFAAESNLHAERVQSLARLLIRGESKPVNALTMELPFNDFKTWSEKHATKVVTEQIDGNNLIFSIVVEDALPRLVLREGEEWAETDLKDRLASNTQLPFDVYIYLPTNSRYVRYLKKDEMLSTDTLERLKRVKLDGCFINKEDCAILLEYCIRLSLAQSDDSAA